MKLPLTTFDPSVSLDVVDESVELVTVVEVVLKVVQLVAVVGVIAELEDDDSAIDGK